MATVREQEPVQAPERELQLLLELDEALRDEGKVSLIVPSGDEVELPDTVRDVLSRVVHYFVQRHSVVVVPIHAELTTQQAADLLRVSRPFLIGLLEKGEIPHHMTGRHRRVLLTDVLDYLHRRDEERGRLLKELTRESQEMGLYEE